VVNATSRPLYPPGKTQHSLYRRLAGWADAANLVPPPSAGIRSLDRSARSESLHLLRYPGHLSTLYKQFSKTCPLRLLFNQNLGCISCFHHACYTAVSLWKCVYIEVFMEVAVLGYYAMEQSTLQEEKRCVTYSERDTSRPMDCRDTQQDRFRFLTAGMSAREMAAVATYTHTHTTRTNGQNHNTTESTWWQT